MRKPRLGFFPGLGGNAARGGQGVTIGEESDQDSERKDGRRLQERGYTKGVVGKDRRVIWW